MEQPARQRKGRTLFRRMLAFLLAILLLQMLIYLAVFFGGGVLDETERNAFYILSERTANRQLDLENEMVQRWSNVKEGKSDLMDVVGQALESNGITLDQLLSDQALCQAVLGEAAPDLVSMLRRNGVTGAFVILDSPSQTEDYPGVYIRDYDPMNYAADNADLLLERGLPEIARSLSIPMDSYWSAFFRFGTEDRSDGSFFYHPMEAIQSVSAEERQNDYFYHWSAKFTLSPDDRPVVAYTVPLVWEDGTVLGVLGVDVTVDYLAEQLTYNELGDNRSGAYFLGVSCDGGNTYTTVCTSGPMFKAYFGQAEQLVTVADAHNGIVTLPDARGAQVYGAIQPLKLYNNNTPFENDRWVLIGLQDGEHLLRFSNQVRTMLLFTAVLSLLLGLAIVFMAARSFTMPISRLVNDLRRSDPNKPISLGRINITELDTLSESIETLSNSAAEAAAQISKIIAMSNIPIGVFEYRRRTGTVFCSQSLFGLLGWPEEPEKDVFLPEDEFLRRLHAVTSGRSIERDGTRAIHVLVNGEERWVQLFYREEDENALGAFLDVTSDVESKRKIEYERDYDVLTRLYNRRAFDQHVEALFMHSQEQPLKSAALMMLDLDNLKYMNDSYGHDYGDRYIRAFADCLGYFDSLQAVVGRRSGDEFNVFLYGYESEEEIRTIVADFWSHMGNTVSTLPGAGKIKVRASGGMAWYGKDANDYDELLRLADFAMYNVKHTVKGTLREFDQVDYAQKSILIKGQDALNRMLENRMVRYALQPILSARDGSVYGYEFLMRPMLEQLSNLEDLFRLARAQSKLKQIEELTWVESLSRFAFLTRTGQLPEEVHAFINSVGNHNLPDSLLADFEERYSDILSRVVVEITEGETAGIEVTLSKKERVHSWGGMLALDDYGTGYNNDSALLDVVPDIVKIDINMVRKINHDDARLSIVRNLVTYARQRNIQVLAEGVESKEEMETLIACGVDYLQGFYLARPDFGVPQVPEVVTEEIRALHKKYFPEA